MDSTFTHQSIALSPHLARCVRNKRGQVADVPIGNRYVPQADLIEGLIKTHMPQFAPATGRHSLFLLGLHS